MLTFLAHSFLNMATYNIQYCTSICPFPLNNLNSNFPNSIIPLLQLIFLSGWSVLLILPYPDDLINLLPREVCKIWLKSGLKKAFQPKTRPLLPFLPEN